MRLVFLGLYVWKIPYTFPVLYLNRLRIFSRRFVGEEEDVNTAEYLILVMLILCVHTDQVEKADRGIYSN